jgi:hypothetical protein
VFWGCEPKESIGTWEMSRILHEIKVFYEKDAVKVKIVLSANFTRNKFFLVTIVC